jgi:multiple RNA-binding domain-containing protein 1
MNSSRIIVKNLPKNYSDDRFKLHFEKFSVTDAKIIKNKFGKSRQFGYVGFKTPQEAAEAVAYFNQSYIDTSKIQVDLAKAFGDANIPRPWSKYSKVSSFFKESAVKKDKKKSEKSEKSKKLNEFLKVIQASKPWSNDDALGVQENTAVSDESDDELYQDTFEDKIPSNKTLKESSVTSFDKIEKSVDKIEKPKQLAEQINQSENKDDQLEKQERIMETGRLFVRNLPFSCNEEELKELFGSFGLISEVM